MAKKKSWFNLLKKFFVSESESRLEKEKRKRWVFTRLKIRRLVASSALSPPRERRHQKAEEKQSKHDINVDVERIAETNADAKTPEVEAEMASLKEGSESIHDPKNETIVPSRLTLRDQETQYFYIYESEIENFAAIKLQTAFRGYLARKALRALKGLVRLQAIVRGRAVRRQAIATLKSLQSIVNIQSEVCAKRCDQVKTTVHCQQNTLLDLGEKDIKIDLNSQKRWDNRYLSREEENKMFSSKREAAIKRERIREYWLSHRRSTESEVNGRRQYWLEQWVDAQLAKRDDLKNVDTLFSARNKEEFERKEIKSRPFLKQYHTDQELVSPIYVPRRSFHHRRQKSSGDDSTFMGSPSIPTYMAATESARAKARSLSSPRLRPINTDVYSEINSPYKYKLSPISSINSDATVTSRIGSVTGLSQRSPCLKGTPVGPIKSTRSIKDLTFGSDGAFANWDRIGACRIISMLSE